MKRFGLSLLCIITCCITGCASLPHGAPLAEGTALRKLSRADAGSPFSFHGDGRLALSRGGLQILDTRSGKAQQIAAERPVALSFEPGGSRLAAAFMQKNGSTVRLYDEAGKAVGETALNGRVTAMAWRDNGELVVAALGIRRYSFGAGLDSFLYRWNGKTPPVSTTVNSTTIRPHIAKLPDEELCNTFSMALSPYGDEVVVTKLKDPPMFNPFLQVVTHHLDTAGGSQIGETSMGSGGALFAPDGEKVLVGTTRGTSRWITVSDRKDTEAYPAAGASIALSPAGSYALVDGHLYHGGTEINTFPPETIGKFSSDGAALVLRYRDALYLLTGINDPPVPVAKDPRLLELRKLFSQGLITREELEKAKRK